MSCKIKSGNAWPTFLRGNHGLSVTGLFIGAHEGQFVTYTRVTCPAAIDVFGI